MCVCVSFKSFLWNLPNVNVILTYLVTTAYKTHGDFKWKIEDFRGWKGPSKSWNPTPSKCFSYFYRIFKKIVLLRYH